jgi:hypothetical protein
MQRQLLEDITNGVTIKETNVWLQRLYQDISDSKDNVKDESVETDTMTSKSPLTTIFSDNLMATNNVKTEGVTARTRHFDIRLMKSRELRRLHIVDFQHVPSTDNIPPRLSPGFLSP